MIFGEVIITSTNCLLTESYTNRLQIRFSRLISTKLSFKIRKLTLIAMYNKPISFPF